ncbi:MAG: glycosyltransferase [Desulfurococcales archaeon]
MIEALYAFRIMSKKHPGLRLFITGKLESGLERALMEFARKLNIHDKILLAGYIPREELFTLKAKALVHLYPSHEDTFPYSVLESLALGTPVVAYDIPALRINFLEKGAEGISLVEEFDVKGLAEEAFKLIGQKAMPPEFPSWEEIMEKELSLLKRLAGKD